MTTTGRTGSGAEMTTADLQFVVVPALKLGRLSAKVRRKVLGSLQPWSVYRMSIESLFRGENRKVRVHWRGKRCRIRR